jgi:hypothetical protein
VLSLHGAGGKGRDNIKNLRQWTQLLTDEKHRRAYPSFVCAHRPHFAGCCPK